MRAGRSRAASTRLVFSLPPLIMAGRPLAAEAKALVESATETKRTNKISNKICVRILSNQLVSKGK